MRLASGWPRSGRRRPSRPPPALAPWRRPGAASSTSRSASRTSTRRRTSARPPSGARPRRHPLPALPRASPSCARPSPPTPPLRRGFPPDPANVFVTVGGKGVMYYAILALVDPGDEVIVPDPGYPIYESVTRFVGGDRGADPDPPGERLPPRHRRAGVARHAADAADRHQLARQPDRRRADPRPTSSGSPRSPSSATSSSSPTRSTRGSCTTERARLDRRAARHGRADDRARRVLQDVRDDRLAPRLRDRPGVAGARVRAAAHQLGLRRHHLRPGRGGRSPRGAAGRGRRDGRRVPRSPRPHGGRPQRDPRHHLPAAEGRVLRLPGHLRDGLDGRDLADLLLQEAGVSVLAGTAFGGVGTDHIRLSYANSRENIAEALRRMRTVVEPLVAAGTGAR